MKKLMVKFGKQINYKEKLLKNEITNLKNISTENYSRELYKTYEFDTYCNNGKSSSSSYVSDLSKKPQAFSEGLDLTEGCNLMESQNLSPLPQTSFQRNNENEKSNISNEKANKEELKRNSSCVQKVSQPRSVYSDFFNAPSLEDILLKESQKPLKSEGKNLNKSTSNIYTINISNSQNFHIGKQNNINIKENNFNNLKKLKSNSKSCDIIHIEDNVDDLLDCDDKLTDDHIILISTHIDHNWKDFEKSLGIEEHFLEESLSQNDSNVTLLIYDSLRKYVSHFPNTTLGFVVSILKQNHQTHVIERLCKRKKEM